MKVIALVSGGKDSCYSALLSRQYGHELVALGNLLPAEKDVDEMDSYMFQTVGHQLVEAYTACTGLPLVRKHIQGGSKHQDLVYSHTEGDEVEDLFKLLAFAKEQLPELQAVATGAIASDYQRLRVENVCGRLGLVSLAYLWHQPQAALLKAMISNEIDAILVKVAAIGLDPHKHLGKSIAAMQPHLLQLRDRYGCNVCGEGGEYETLTLDCRLFSHGRIVLDDWEVVLHSPDTIAPVGVLHPKAFHVEPKEQGPPPDAPQILQVPDDYQPPPPPASPWTAPDRFHCECPDMPPLTLDASTTCWNGPGTAMVCAQAWAGGVVDCQCEGVTSMAMQRALEAVAATLKQQGLCWEDSLMVHLYLHNMGHFAALNRVYCQFFPAINPPARATVQAPLSEKWVLAVSVLLARHPSPLPRRMLHVQSISCWAPSNIGPYCQAAVYGSSILMAGSIALDPPTMTLVSGGVSDQARRALASSEAVAVALRSSVRKAACGWTVYLAEAAGCTAQHEVQSALQEFVRGAATASAVDADEEAGEPGADEHLDDYLRPPVVPRPIQQPDVLYLTVPALPRGSLVEVEPVAVDPAAITSTSAGDGDEQPERLHHNVHSQNAPGSSDHTAHTAHNSNGGQAHAGANPADGVQHVKLPDQGNGVAASLLSVNGKVVRLVVTATPEPESSCPCCICPALLAAAQQALARVGCSLAQACSAVAYYVPGPLMTQDALDIEMRKALQGLGRDPACLPQMLPMLRIGLNDAEDCKLALDVLVVLS